MSWNIRVMRYEDGGVGLHEVFYNDNGEIVAWTKDQIRIAGVDLDDLKKYIDLINKDIERFGNEEKILDHNMKPEGSWDIDEDEELVSYEEAKDRLENED